MPNLTANQKAFLDTISVSEGTYGKGDDGYNVIVGGDLFTDYSDHPRRLVELPRLGIKSTAAGRYQLLERYFDYYKAQLRLPDFSPDSQDLIALQQIKERKALDDIESGDIQSALVKCSNIWASLPGNNYGQHENKMAALLETYDQFSRQA